MENKHYSRKQRQLKYLVKQLTILLQKTDADLKSEIKKMTAKIKYLVSQLNGIVSTNRMKRILGTIALFVGISFSNTANAQYFQPPVTNPFGIVPSANILVSIPSIGDLDGDGDLDLLTQEYDDNTSSMNFKYSENIGTTNTPQFISSVTNPYNLTDDSIPRFHNLVDLDGDGDLDVLSLDAIELNDTINYNYGYLANFNYYENIGTLSNPIFDTLVTNPFGLVSDSAWAVADLVDIDNDGDLDILYSSNSDYESYTYYGYTYTSGTPPKFKFIENIGDANNPIFTTPVDNPFGLIIPGGISSPAFMDYDNDGDFDLFVGAMDTAASSYYNYAASIFYFENTGTNTVAQFAAPLPNPFGLTPITQFAFLEIADLDGDGDDDILAGEYYGNLMYFENDTTAPAPVASWDCVNFNCTDPGNGSGTYTSLSDCQIACVVPISWDCDPTLGCIDPGTGAGTYTTFSDCQVNCNSTSVNDLSLKNDFTFNTVNKIIETISTVLVYDINGKLVLTTNNKLTNISHLNKGIYILKSESKTQKIIVN